MGANIKQRTLDFMRDCGERWDRRADDLHYIQTLMREGQVTLAEAADMLQVHADHWQSLAHGAAAAAVRAGNGGQGR
jgi:hypothetical protein